MKYFLIQNRCDLNAMKINCNCENDTREFGKRIQIEDHLKNYKSNREIDVFCEKFARISS